MAYPKSDDLFTKCLTDQSDPLIRHLFEESAALNVYDTSCINLAAGAPGPDLLKPLTQFFREATLHRMAAEDEDNHYIFQYGPTAGFWSFRDVLAKFLSAQYKQPVNRSDLVLTCGASHGIHLIVSTLLAPGAVIFLEEYTYMIAISTFQAFPSYKIVKVPMTSDGVDVNKFDSIVKEMKNNSTCETSEQKPFWGMYYTIPTFHNPTGTLLPPDSCRSVVKTARQQGVLVVCDDVYNLLHYGEGPPPSRLYTYDDPRQEDYAGGNVISNGSFSKIMSPGIRVGWMEMAPRLVQLFRQSGMLQSGGSVNNVMFGLVQSIIELGLAEKQLKWYQQVYKDRMKTLCQTLKENLPEGCTFHAAEGGYFVWVQLPVDGSKFVAWSRDHGGPGAVPASRFVPPGDSDIVSSLNALRLSIGFHNSAVLKQAGKDICTLLQTYLNL